LIIVFAFTLGEPGVGAYYALTIRTAGKAFPPVLFLLEKETFK
jgi:hypothetical protein